MDEWDEEAKAEVFQNLEFTLYCSKCNSQMNRKEVSLSKDRKVIRTEWECAECGASVSLLIEYKGLTFSDKIIRIR